MRKPCSHGVVLQPGLKCNHGYIGLYLNCNGRTIAPTFGKHTKDTQEIAEIKLAEFKRQIRDKKYLNIEPEKPSKKFAEVAALWFKLWAKERNPDGTEAHNEESCYKVKWTIEKVLIPRYGNSFFECIRSIDIDKWRQTLVTKGISGVTVNRYQAVLSSVFSHTIRWVECERIKPGFKVPLKNPCDAVEMAPTRKRERILTQYEASKLKLAFSKLNDQDGWEICKMALKSVLSLKDLKALEIGSEINTVRTKTGTPVNIPLTVVSKLNFFGWRTRWEKARKEAGLEVLHADGTIDKEKTPQFRDLRKTPMNWVTGNHDMKLISQYMGHASIKTTEKSYIIKQADKMQPILNDISSIVDNL